ncbi:MAG: DUF3089 domain-containing protein [Saprospiraceae bacterium]|nr:DUF3089 domain-containing protein [Saprospiraceae bacterium]
MSSILRFLLFLPALGLLAGACSTARPRLAFDPKTIPAAPDYADLNNWAAHPDKADPADRTPRAGLSDGQAQGAVDVFFLYPTTYTGTSRAEKNWNAAVDDAATNQKTDSSSILFQASIFNGAGRVFAPRYRQAHLHTFFTQDKKSAAQALDLAYEDAKAAFRYYLEHWNQGRPFILAGHSQGGRHGLYLLRDMVENTPLQDQLVVAYLAGWPVSKTFLQQLKPCQSPDDTGCYCSWRTWERRYALRHSFEQDIVCTNPLNWSTQPGQYAPKSLNQGAVLRKFNVVFPALCDAEIRDGILMSNKPKFPGSIFFTRKNYHIGDLNLYYFNVRENAMARAAAVLVRKK